ncbi:MAG: ATP-binding cassette domain-containing protein, partial [Staphylococcus epidermidis]|nr:ATP-binding cassette domain-containing protein [Staphylococcus epidermidis]
MKNLNNIIEINNLTKQYGSQIAVNNLSITVESGQIYGFLGRNGAGKTTFVETLMGSIRPDQGDIKVFGKHPIEFSAREWTRIGLVQQHWKDHEKWLVEEHLK